MKVAIAGQDLATTMHKHRIKDGALVTSVRAKALSHVEGRAFACSHHRSVNKKFFLNKTTKERTILFLLVPLNAE